MRGVLNIFLIFHLAIPLLIFEIPKIKDKYEINRFALIIGSLYPDLVDKSLSFFNIGGGRGYAHTILFVLISFVFLFIITKGNKTIYFPFLIGMIMHLLLDMPRVPLFYPFISYEIMTYKSDIEQWLQTLLTNPIVITTEITGVIILIFIVINNKLYSISEFVNYLKTKPKITIKKTD